MHPRHVRLWWRSVPRFSMAPAEQAPRTPPCHQRHDRTFASISIWADRAPDVAVAAVFLLETRPFGGLPWAAMIFHSCPPLGAWR